jgi:exopolysaccharide biosynthesis polyprenyl glycosylphosphotransferase
MHRLEQMPLVQEPWRYLKPLVDGVLFVVAFLLAYWIRYGLQWFIAVEPIYLVPLGVYVPSIIMLTMTLLMVHWVEGAYRVERGRSLLDELYVVFRATLVSIATVIVIVFLTGPSYYSRLIFGYTGIASLVLLGVARGIERAVIRERHRRGKGIERVLIVGAGEMGRTIIRAVMARPELGYQIVGFVDDDPDKAETSIGPYPSRGTTDDLMDAIRDVSADQVIVTLPWTSHSKILQIVRRCQILKVQVRIVPDLFQIALSSVMVETLDGIPLFGLREPRLRGWQRFFKRVADLAVSVLALLLLSPVFLVLAIAIKLDSPGPVVFCQTRVGLGRRHFVCFKFRTMRVDAEQQLAALLAHNEATGPIFKMRDDPRRTRVGRFLRRTSLDELPQIWNVVRGEMSLIGPRPPIPAEVEEYEPWHLQRLQVPPGITGLWQVSGRSDLTFDEMVLLDVYYIENWSPLMDLRIVLKTIPTVLFGSGAY